MSYYAGAPISYQRPQFPALYWPFDASPGEAQYIYSLEDIWVFTLYWTLLTIPLAHLIVSVWAVLMQLSTAYARYRYLYYTEAGRTLSKKNRKLMGEKPIQDCLAWVWLIPVIYLLVGGLEALVAGSVVGLVLGAVYNAGYFRMSTWTPFIWGVANMLVLILGGFRIQGGL